MSGRYARCPKCGNTDLGLIEVHEEIGEAWGKHEVYNGTVIPAEEFTFTPGDPVRVEMDCPACGHSWRSRRTVA